MDVTDDDMDSILKAVGDFLLGIIKGKWVIIEVEKRYDDIDRKKKEPLDISDIENIYAKNLDDLQKEDFYGGAICSQNITDDYSSLKETNDRRYLRM